MEPEYKRKEFVILTVEAGETALSTRKLVIESAGFNALSAVNCQQALKFVEKYPVHAVLFDTDVTDVPIADFIAGVREECPDIPVYVVASSNWPTPPAEIKREIAGFFQKMDDPKKIIDEIVRVFPVNTHTLS